MQNVALDSRENGAGGVITGETGLAHTGTIVDNKGSNLVLPGGVSDVWDVRSPMEAHIVAFYLSV